VGEREPTPDVLPQRLGVHEHAVEIEDHALDRHVPHVTGQGTLSSVQVSR
jgi:hypothetical protein